MTCHETCKTCIGAEYYYCTECNIDRYLDSNQCLLYTCDSTCDTCSGTTSNDCLSCPGGRYLDQSSCLLCDSAC